MKVSRKDILSVIELLEFTGKKEATLTLRRYDLTCAKIRKGWKITVSREA